jgi:signal transduction histidine kinase
MPPDAKIQAETYAYFTKFASELFFILSQDGTILEANQYAQNLTARPLIGEPIRDVIVDFTNEFDLIALAKEASTERLFNVGMASGLPQSFYFTFKPVSDRILVFGRIDADELETMRQALLALNQELNNLMRELHQKNAQLQRLNAEKNRFLGMAAHDLRKPIGLVITYSEFLIDEAKSVLNNEHMGFLHTIQDSCTFMKRLVDDFLDVSAIEAGKFDLDMKPASMDAVLAHSLKLNQLQAKKKGIDLKLRCQDGLPPIVMDAPKIEQAITNLVSNAVEHTPAQSRVQISLSCDARQLTFSVKDQGPGIPFEEQKKLFKPFAKTSIKKTGGEKSTGLGMLITRKIIEAHNGQIGIDSRVGAGTTIYFKLPIGQEEK